MLFLVSLVLVLGATASPAQPVKPTLTVATRVIPPFVMQEGQQLAGFSIELWKNIATEMGVTSKFVVLDTLPNLLQTVAQRKADLGIAAISMTSERDRSFDFSYPILNAGLQILVRHPKHSTAQPNLISALFSTSMLQILGAALLMVAVISHLVWIVERRHPETMISQQYFPGIFEAAWWAASTLATQADQMPRGGFTRLIAILWMFTAVVFVALFTATFTTNLTVQQLQGEIQSLEDLNGRKVATTTGSTASAFLRDRDFKPIEFPAIEQAYSALLGQQVDAIVFDVPVLMYYAAREGKGRVQLVGNVVREENYGIVMPANSPNRKRINAALLKLRENGTYQALYDQFFKAAS
jgi:polar amino acid transport system substrate-binding protein